MKTFEPNGRWNVVLVYLSPQYGGCISQSGMSSGLMIKKSIAMVEFIDWWLRLSIAMVEINDCWLRMMVAMVQKAIEYQDWRLLWSKKKIWVSENDRPEIDDPERL